MAMVVAIGCGDPKPKPKSAADEKFDADAKSGPDGKRSGARALKVNTPITDEVNFANQDKNDWYQVELKGKAGVLSSVIHWDNDNSDIMIDVFDEFGKQISASPVRNKGSKQKELLTQIDKPGIYYVRVSAPVRGDGSVYTMEAKWDAPAEVAQVPQPQPVKSMDPKDQPEPMPEPKRTHREHREKPEKPAGEPVEGRIVQAYREGAGLTLHIDKGSAAGIKPGMSGTVLSGSSGEDALDGGDFKIVSVLDANKSVGKSSIRSIGKNNRVMINVTK
jgi:hypothetical protein